MTTSVPRPSDYHQGARYPHLTRDDSKPDYLDDLIKARAAAQ